MVNQQWDALWINARIMTCEQGIEVIAQGALAVKDQQIAWLGTMAELNDAPLKLAKTVHDVAGKLLTPGLVDCHTHLIYAGSRTSEFAARLQGESYESIARRGGGIQSTVVATRNASEDELFAASLPRAEALMQSGVTTIEIKSGYGLNMETESKILRVANRIEQALPLTIYKTFLGAHTIPPEYKDHPDRYVDLVCNEMIPEIAEQKLAQAVDVFCENIAFSPQQSERIFATANQYGLAIKCHAEQLSHQGAAALAAKYQALSADHLEYADANDVMLLAAAETVAVLLPGAYYFLREEKMPPIDLLRQHHVAIAIASDSNPGTSPILSLPLIMHLACTLFRLTPAEAWLAVTKQAAKSLDKKAKFGTITVGKQADFAIWRCYDPIEICYYAGLQFLHSLVKKGSPVKC